MTRSTPAAHGGLQVTNRILALNDSLLQEAYIYAPDSNTSIELVPVHSPLQRESYLVSCPPNTYVLKVGLTVLTSLAN